MLLNVITPIFDPDGDAFEFFLRLRDSVLSQVGIQIAWHISVQSISSRYLAELEALSRLPHVTVYDRSEALSLAGHLNIILTECPVGAIHILCQDDSYVTPFAAAAIGEALRVNSVLHIAPRVDRTDALHRVQERPSPNPVSNNSRRSRRVVAGINTLGGLSTLAWRSDQILAVPSITFELMADCQLRAFLWGHTSVEPLQVTGVLREEQWKGQAQNWMRHLRRGEANAWVRLHPHGSRQSFGFAIEALRCRNRFLAKAWLLASLNAGRK